MSPAKPDKTTNAGTAGEPEPEPQASEDEAAPPPPANRAERRARSKGKVQVPPPGKIHHGQRNDVPSTRQWSHRRSG